MSGRCQCYSAVYAAATAEAAAAVVLVRDVMLPDIYALVRRPSALHSVGGAQATTYRHTTSPTVYCVVSLLYCVLYSAHVLTFARLAVGALLPAAAVDAPWEHGSGLF